MEQLQRKNLAELKEIGWQLNVFPEGDRRCRQSWIDALVNVNLPLLQLLEVSPPVAEVQAQEPIKQAVKTSPGVEVEPVQEPPLESKFGRIVYPTAAKLIAQNEEARPQLDRTEGADVHNRPFHPTKSDRDSSGAKTEALGSQEGERVLAVAGNHQTDRGRVLSDLPVELTNFTEAGPVNRDEGRDRLENEPRMSRLCDRTSGRKIPRCRLRLLSFARV